MSENPARDAGPKGTPVAATKRRSGVRDDDDVAEVGHWQRDKLALLTEYIKISRSARTKYLAPSEATYVDLFRGSGRARVEGTNEEIDGSAVAAWRAAKECGVPFSRVFIADASASKVGACETRLRELAAPIVADVGDADETVKRVCAKLNPHGLHFALLDPYNLGDLPFTVITGLVKLKRIDLMIHLSTGDLQRNLHSYSASESAKLDAFAPHWRAAVDFRLSPFKQRLAIVDHWFKLLEGLNLPLALKMHRARNTTRTTLYWLVFVSRADVARRFWDYAHNYLSQPPLI